MKGKAGEWAYLAAVAIAVLAGIATGVGITVSLVPLLLVVLGIVVGLLNITEKETQSFLLSSAALLLAGTAGFITIDNVIPSVGTMLDAIVKNIGIMVAPAAVIVAVKAIQGLASKK